MSTLAYPTYYSSPISENIEETPEGFLICHDVPIARTGWQTYKVSELPQAAADRLGIDTKNGNADIDVYRDPEDVFSPDCLASFEGKPVTDNHPPDFVEPANFKQYACGHVQNVREGKEPLESGDYPILADLHIDAEPLLSKVRSKATREVSCGYDYSLRREGDKVLQVDITGNHVAVVPKGRAGPEARINDSMPVAPATLTSTNTTKEKKPVNNVLRHLLGLGLKAYAADAEPEKLAEAAEAVKSVNDKPAHDEEVVGEEKPAMDSRARAHAALDRVIDRREADNAAKEEIEGGEHAMDADIDELKNLLGEYFTEEEEEPQHVADAETEEEEEEEEEEKEFEEEAAGVQAADRGHAADARGGAMRVLRGLRPFVARTNDKAMKEAFNTALASISGSSRPTSGSYGRFAASSRARDAAPRKPVTAPVAARGRAADADTDPIAKLQKAYDNAREGK